MKTTIPLTTLVLIVTVIFLEDDSSKVRADSVGDIAMKSECFLSYAGKTRAKFCEIKV